MKKRWKILAVLMLAIGGIGGVLAAAYLAGPAPGVQGTGRPLMIRMRAFDVSTGGAASEALLRALAINPKSHGTLVVDARALSEMRASLTEMMSSADATVLTSPSLMINGGSSAVIEVSRALGGGREEFVVDARADVVDEGVSLDLTVVHSTAKGPIQLAMHDLGLGGRRARTHKLPPVGAEDAMVVWLAADDGGVLVVITASPMP